MSCTEAVRDDSDLISACLAGRRDCFDALVARHYRGIYSMICRMVGNQEDAADLTQESFLRAYTRLGTFQRGRSFPAWLRAIASNLCIDHLRRRKAPPAPLDERLESGVMSPGTGIAPLAAPDPSPQRRLEMAEDTRRVLAAVERLPARQRVVLVLRHIEGLKIEEIADALHMPLGTVKTMLFRGRRAVRNMVGEL